MGRGVKYGVYKATCALARLFFPRPELVGLENLPDEPCVLVGNHAQMHGPIVSELYLPFDRAIWCIGEMMHLKEVPAYAFQDFWSGKPRSVRWLYKIASYLIAPLSVCVFNNAHCIGVYRDARVMNTFRQSLEALGEGKRVVIFPECAEPHNRVVYRFQEPFITLGRMYGRKGGKRLAFVPMYLAPALGKLCFGPPVYYDPAANPDAERQRVCEALMDGVTALAEALPRHRVVPYLNLPKRDYPMNRDEGEDAP